ncbi:MAG TPA: alpha/beta hydrolase [Mycobacterium sp.]|jgi:pimeloyl-ACP methyl ester carboxylesterase|nr:alpha/beta hydrolase [Mycobacterium sp.]HEX4587438.1 alpha/beta hydrolase [Mycobacterium sp.]
MALPALVLVHGGAHAADCWDLTVDEIHRREPNLTVLAVNLPGRRGKSGTVAATITECVDSVIADIEDAGLDELVICGHSLGGVTVPGVVAKLGLPRVREMILAAAFLPPQGASVLDSVGGPLAWYARRLAASRRTPAAMPRIAARLAFCNGMAPFQREFVLSRICGESLRLVTEMVDRGELPDEVSWTWILTRRDRALSQRQQHRSIATLPGAGTVIPIDTCHDLMVSEPSRLAEILVERCRADET